ncbi:metallophosphoesterase family protein [Sphingobacterium composti Ten et al. 2007 non Yoo et al. 2007]|uniref:metallophosphoesterase family protein n=1 Tax=Sphingobacterium composti TaxID=363260 RepID=UPI00135734FC|nr:metallophosphoesterase [Sphingobacterium composti Ten et al. 2007 non Yoo et al. 2007]
MYLSLSLITSLTLCVLFTSCITHRTPTESKNKNLKILLISDLNDSYGSVTYSKEVHEVVRRVKDINPDIILCGGDMVAGQKASLTASRLDSMWSAFDQSVLTPINILGVPFGFTMGNHDASPSYHLDRAAASSFWKLNKEKANLTYVDDTHFPYYFSYIKNNVFFISWDASSSAIPVEVKVWMQNQLASSIANKSRARIVLGHLPLYAIVAAKNKNGEVLNDADETLAFLQDNNVDMYISGHQHAYYPATKEQVTLLHAGCLGGGPREILGHPVKATKAYAILELPRQKKIVDIQIIGFEPASHRHILLESLPDSVSGFNGRVFKWQGN